MLCFISEEHKKQNKSFIWLEHRLDQTKLDPTIWLQDANLRHIDSNVDARNVGRTINLELFCSQPKSNLSGEICLLKNLNRAFL